jgi:hypothetical protein
LFLGIVGTLCAVTAVAWAGRIARGGDAGFELCRVVSAYRGRTSETIAPGETRPTQPVTGETILIGTSTVFPESVRIETFRDGQGWRQLQPSDFAVRLVELTPEVSHGVLSAVVIRFAPEKVALVQNAFVRITIFPFPGPDPVGDVVEGVFLRSP